MAHEATKPQREITPEEWQRVREILANAVEIADGDRSAYLDQACGSDSVLRGRIDELIAAHDAIGASSLDVPAFSITSSDSRQQELRSSEIGRRIGAYRIEAEIAHGGMGTVYRAVRADDEYQKQVAIKLMDRGTLSRRGAELFRHERQILASLEHPNIARLLDGGTNEDGSPYLVMEYVEGQTITEYCDIQRLSVEDRLKLFQKVCSAVHFAHQNLVVHRDIKPANILVTEGGEPKLLDFGIAKILGGNLTEVQTQTVGAMTPAYASPEQLNGRAVTTSTDVYSLGLVLYELLTGRYAYEAFSTPVRRQQAILEEDPQRPSQAVLQEAKHLEQAATPQQIGSLRQLPVEKLCKRLAGDLESIIAKAIRKEPEHRYRSADQLSDDIRRHLEALPVSARDDTLIYRAAKFISRHRLGVAAAVFVGTTVLAALFVTLHEAQIASLQRSRAERRFDDVRQLANSLLFDIHDTIQDIPGSTGARKILVERALKYLDSLAQEAAGDPILQLELASAYERLGDVQGKPSTPSLGDSQGALRSYAKALALRESVARNAPGNQQNLIRLAQTHRVISSLMNFSGDVQSAMAHAREAVRIASLGSDNDKTDYAKATELAWDYKQVGDIEWNYMAFASLSDSAAALSDFQNGLQTASQLVKRDPANTQIVRLQAIFYERIGMLLAQTGRRREGLEQLQSSLKIFRALAAASDSSLSQRGVAADVSQIGVVLTEDGKPSEALNYFLEELAIFQKLADADPRNVQAREDLAGALFDVGDSLERQGKPIAGLAFLRRAISISKQILALDPKRVDYLRLEAGYRVGESEAWTDLGRTDESLHSLRQAQDIYEQIANLDPNNKDAQLNLLATGAKIAATQLKQGSLSRAQQGFQQVLSFLEPFLNLQPDRQTSIPNGLTSPSREAAVAFIPPQQALYTAADAYAALGDIESKRLSSSPSNQEKIIHCRKAADFYRRSIDTWNKIPHPARTSPNGFRAGDPKLIAHKLYNAELQLARNQY